MQLGIWNDILTITALVLSILSFILGYFTLQIRREKFNPVLEVEVTNFPPYKKNKKTTAIKVKNSGGRTAYLENVQIRLPPFLNEPIVKRFETWELVPGEFMIEGIALPCPDVDYKLQMTIYYRYGWRKRIRTSKYLEYHLKAESTK